MKQGENIGTPTHESRTPTHTKIKPTHRKTRIGEAISAPFSRKKFEERKNAPTYNMNESDRINMRDELKGIQHEDIANQQKPQFQKIYKNLIEEYLRKIDKNIKLSTNNTDIIKEIAQSIMINDIQNGLRSKVKCLLKKTREKVDDRNIEEIEEILKFLEEKARP